MPNTNPMQINRRKFERFALSRVYAVPFAHNRASCRVLEKAGFRRVGAPPIGHDGVEELLMELPRADA